MTARRALFVQSAARSHKKERRMCGALKTAGSYGFLTMLMQDPLWGNMHVPRPSETGIGGRMSARAEIRRLFYA